MVSPKQQIYIHLEVRCFDLRYCLTGKSGQLIYKNVFWVGLPRGSPGIELNIYVYLFHCDLPREEICLEMGTEILFEFSCPLAHLEIFECGVRIDTEKADISSDGSDESRLNQVSEVKNGEPIKVPGDPYNSDGLCDLKSEKVFEVDNVKGKGHINCWSWLFICFGLSHYHVEN